MGRVVIVLVASLLGVLGCGGPQATPTPTELAAAAFSLAGDLRYGCGGRFGFDPAVLDQRGNAELGDDPLAAVLRAHLTRTEVDVDWLPDHGWLLVGADERGAQFVARDQLGGLMSVNLENGPDGWQVIGWGECRADLILPGHLGLGDWLLDPDEPTPQPTTARFTAMVTERDCASGQSSVGRVVGPEIRFEPGRVLAAFGVVPLPGGIHRCPGNPPTPIVVVLGQPLGDRLLVDAGHLPYEDVRTLDPMR